MHTHTQTHNVLIVISRKNYIYINMDSQLVKHIDIGTTAVRTCFVLHLYAVSSPHWCLCCIYYG